MTRPGTIVVFPAYDDNPFLRLLLSVAKERGSRIVSTVSLDDLEARLKPLGRGDVLHWNWVAQVSQKPRTPWGAKRSVDRTLRMIDAAQARGVRLVWTLHNTLSHDARNAAQDARLHQELADRADLIHVMNRATQSVVTDFRLPQDRIRYLPHPSYVGVYPAGVDRQAARARLGVADDAFAVLALGHMKRYKGVLDLIDAVALSERKPTLLLAGQGTPSDWKAIDARIPASVQAVRNPKYVPDGETPWWFAAADAMVLPYRRILNSGSAMLAATFATAVVMPDEPAVVGEYGDQDWVVTFDRDDRVRSLASVLDDTTIGWAAKGASAAQFAATLPPREISEQFDDLLCEAVSR
ncbi:MAG: glycosyltransferase [Agrococcus casei]|uniref:glycosyltransferase n=1 Tax=Agrococcus casei TaxID=343512 RepID=UPI003F9DE516